MYTKNSIPISLLILLSGNQMAHAAGGGHADPLRAMDASGRQDVQADRSAPAPQAPAKHYSPLDALRGRMIIRKPAEPSRKNPSKNAFSTSTKMKRQATHSRTHALQTETPVNADEASARRPSPMDMLNTNPNRRPNQSRHEKTVIKVIQMDTASPARPAKKHSVIRSAPVQRTGNLDVSEIGSESPVPHVPVIPLVAVPTYKTLPVASMPRHQQRTTAAHIPAGQKILYMTFDDGPLKGTGNLLNVIKEEQVKATMFYIGRNVVHAPQLFRRALSMPNVLVANHTYTHANNHYRRFYTSSVKNVVQDIDKAQNVIGGAKYMRLCGRDVWRLPHVHRNDWAISVAERGREIDKYDALANRGYFIYGWDIEWLFSHKTQKPLYSGAEMARRVNLQYRSGRTVKKGKIILLAHDFMWRSASNVRQLRTFIRIMKAQGWTFRTIDSYSDITPAVYVRNRQKHPKIKAPTKLAANPGKFAAVKPAVIALPPKAQAPRTARIGKITIVTPADLARQLSVAIRKQQFLAIRRLIAKGANVNARDAAGNIPLNLAIQTNNAVLVRMLVERGANIFNVDGHGMSPMGIAREHHNTIIIRYLIKQIAKQKQHRLHKTPFSMEA